MLTRSQTMTNVQVLAVVSGLLVTVVHLQTGNLKLRSFRFGGLSL